MSDKQTFVPSDGSSRASDFEVAVTGPTFTPAMFSPSAALMAEVKSARQGRDELSDRLERAADDGDKASASTLVTLSPFVTPIFTEAGRQAFWPIWKEQRAQGEAVLLGDAAASFSALCDCLETYFDLRP